MKFNNPKIKYTLIALLLIFSLSCINSEKNQNHIKVVDRLSKDSLYSRKWIKVEFGDNRVEEVEIYISKNNDTITNQFKPFKNSNIDTLKSEFYDLKITESKKRNTFKGEITIYSKYYKLKLDEKNSKTLEFHYWEQNLDSIWNTTKKTETSNSIEFEFENVLGNRLLGLLYLTVQRDTIINNEEMVNLFVLPILVDNRNITDNFYLDGFRKKNKFNPDKLKYIVQ